MSNRQFNNFITQQNLADESLIAFLRDANYGTKDLASYQQYLKDTGKATSTFSILTSKAGTVLKSFSAAMASMGFNWIIVSLIGLAVKFVDDMHTTLEEQQEITEKLKGELSEIQSEISSVNSELKTTTDRINELNSKDSLSFIEQEELKNLIATNKELERRNRLLAEQEASKQREVTASVRKEFNKEYGSRTYARISSPHSESEIADIQQKRARYEELYNNDYRTDKESEEFQRLKLELEEWDRTTSSFTEHIQEVISAYGCLSQKKMEGAELTELEEKQLAAYRNELVDTALDLEDYRDRYGVNDEVRQSWGTLSESIYECLYPAKYRTDRFNEIFSGLPDKLQSELKELARQGTLSASYLTDHLASGFMEKFTQAGFSAGEIVEQIYADLENSMLNKEFPVPLSITETINQLNTKLGPALDSLRSAYQNIFTEDGFTLENVDLSMLDSISSTWEHMFNGLEIDIDSLGFDNLIKVLSDSSSTADKVQDAFTSLTASILNSTCITDDLDRSTAQLISSMLQSMGIANAEELVYDSLNAKLAALALQKRFAAQYGYELSAAANDNAAAFLNEADASETARAYLFRLAAAEQIFGNSSINTEEKIRRLKELATAYGQTAIVAHIASLEKATHDGHMIIDYDKELAALQDNINNNIDNIQIDFNSIGGGKSETSAAGTSAGKSYVDAFEEELQALEDIKNNGLISEKEYLDRLRVLYERYFKDKLGYEKEFAKYQKQYLDGYKSLYESVFSHAAKLIGDRIDLIGDEKDKAIDALEAQKKAAEDSYNAQIKLLEEKKDALQDEIDKIKEANEDREEAISLQEKERNLARAENQKTILQYTKDRGFIYTVDEDAIRDAKNELESAKSDAEIRALEKKQDALDKQIDDIQKKIDASNEYWDAQIEQAENYYDTMIKGLEEYKSRWEELSDLQEHAEMIALLKELGLTEEDLLNESSGAFDRLRTSYLGILKDLNTGNQGVIDGLSQLANIDMSSIPGFLEQTKAYADSIADIDVTALSDGLDGVSNRFSNIADSASNAASAISGGGGAATAGSDGQTKENSSQGNTTNTGSGSSLKEAIADVSTGSIPEIDKITDAFAGEGEDSTSVTGAVQKVNDKIKNDDDSLASALFEQTKDALDEENGIPAQKTAWEELNGALETAVGYITTLQSTLTDMDGKKFTITLNVSGNGAATVGTLAGKHIASGNAKVNGTAHIDGTADVQGNWGIKESGRTLVGELGQEIWVHSKDGTFETVGDNGAEFINPEKGDIIFDHMQTRQLLDKGNITGRGKAYVDGTAFVNGNVQKTDGTVITPDGKVLTPIQPGDREWDMLQKFNAYFDSIDRNVEKLVPNSLYEYDRQINEVVNQINNSSIINNRNVRPVINQEIHVTLPNVTNSTSADALLRDLQSISYKKYQEFI